LNPAANEQDQRAETDRAVRRYIQNGNPIRPHEAAIVSSILRIHTGEHFWRFQKHVYYPGCRRELTTLDYFLSGLKHHTVDFILKQICPDYEQHGTCDHEADAISVSVEKRPWRSCGTRSSSLPTLVTKPRG
jgi:hypothetical protein